MYLPTICARGMCNSNYANVSPLDEGAPVI